MEPVQYLDLVRTDGEALAAVARLAPSAPVESCPDWDMTGLLAHVGAVHRWAERIIHTRSTTYLKRASPLPEGSAATLDWYDEGLSQLLATLSATDPDALAWNWFDGAAAPVRFWFRRMAHETAVHRWDGEAAADRARPIDTDLAVDGIDEFLGFVALWLARQPVVGLEGSLHLHATDTDGEWALDLWPDRIEHRREHTKADAALRGPVSDLLLWLLNRVPAGSPTLQAFGDSNIIERWRQVQF